MHLLANPHSLLQYKYFIIYAGLYLNVQIVMYGTFFPRLGSIHLSGHSLGLTCGPLQMPLQSLPWSSSSPVVPRTQMLQSFIIASESVVPSHFLQDFFPHSPHSFCTRPELERPSQPRRCIVTPRICLLIAVLPGNEKGHVRKVCSI